MNDESQATEQDTHLTLKWGTLKAWNFEGNDEALRLLKRYMEIGSSFSAMTQHDTPEQKDIICKLIDLTPGDIFLGWDGKYVSKDEAKKYVMEYGKSNAATERAESEPSNTEMKEVYNRVLTCKGAKWKALCCFIPEEARKTAEEIVKYLKLRNVAACC